MNSEIDVIEVPLTVRPESPTSGGLSDDVVGRELGQSNFGSTSMYHCILYILF